MEAAAPAAASSGACPVTGMERGPPVADPFELEEKTLSKQNRLCKALALATFVAACSPAWAAIARDDNGELFFNVHDTVNRVSYTLDLGLNMSEFFNFAQQNEGYQRFWVIDSAIFSSFLSRVADPAALQWSVLAFDGLGNTQAGGQRLFTTVRQGQEASLSSFTNSQFSLGVTGTATVTAIGSFNISGTHGASGAPLDFTVHGEHLGDANLVAPGNLNYYGLTGGLTPTLNNNAPFSATNTVGQSSWFYYLTRSGTSNLSSARVLIDEFDNGNPTDGGRDGYWGFTLASNAATTLPEWVGKYLLSFTMPVFSPVLRAETRQFAAEIGRTEYSGGFYTEMLNPQVTGSFEAASGSAPQLLATLASASGSDPGLPSLLAYSPSLTDGVSPVPEPRSLLLLGMGLGAVLVLQRRRRSGPSS